MWYFLLVVLQIFSNDNVVVWILMFSSPWLSGDFFFLSCRASGYLLFPLFLMTAAIGGNYSSWASSVVNVGVRVLVYTLAPISILIGLWSRIRLSKMDFRQ